MNKHEYKLKLLCSKCYCLVKVDYSPLVKNRKGDSFYCESCVLKNDDIMSTNIKPLIQEDPDKLLEACINTPPLRLKDLKERLKREREEKKQRTK